MVVPLSVKVEVVVAASPPWRDPAVGIPVVTIR
jgi:hypothetical protein